jgi:hypothetical protein
MAAIFMAARNLALLLADQAGENSEQDSSLRSE